MYLYRVIYKKSIRKTRVRDAPRRDRQRSIRSARRGERGPFVTSVSVDEGEFNAESYEPSAE